MRPRHCATALLACLLAVSCAGDRPEKTRSARTRPLVVATVYPLQFFIERLAGDLVDCEVALPHGADPQHWIPDRAILQRLATADLLVFHGADLESWRRKVGLPRSRQSVVCTGLDEHFLKIEGATVHTHGGDSHTHDGIDPFLWLDLKLASREAAVVARAMKRLLPKHGKTIDANLSTLQRDLVTEHRAHSGLDIPGESVLATARRYDYWARSHGLRITNVSLDDTERIAPEAIALARQAIAEHGTRLALCPKELPGSVRKALENLGVAIVVFDPCSTLASGRRESLLTVMAANRERVAAALLAIRGK